MLQNLNLVTNFTIGEYYQTLFAPHFWYVNLCKDQSLKISHSNAKILRIRLYNYGTDACNTYSLHLYCNQQVQVRNLSLKYGIVSFLLDAEFPLQVHLSSGHTNFTINWKEYSICTTTLHFHIIWVPVIAGSGQEEWNMKNQAYTRGTNYTISDLNSTYSYKVIVNVRQVPGAGELRHMIST